jgi:hypothetical protein
VDGDEIPGDLRAVENGLDGAGGAPVVVVDGFGPAAGEVGDRLTTGDVGTSERDNHELTSLILFTITTLPVDRTFLPSAS